jgi:rubredoxin
MNELVNPKLHRILVKGGVLSPAEMLRIIAMAEDIGLTGMHFGSRQDILLPLSEIAQSKLKDHHAPLGLEALADSKTANISCSYVTADIFPSTSWLTSATYLYVLEQFQFMPELEVNITDPRQRMVPLFTGHLNFIASPEEDFWFLYIQLPGWTKMETFPALIHSWDLAKVTMAIDPFGSSLPDLKACVAKVNDKQRLNTKSIQQDLTIPFHPFPYYEGMNRLDDHHYWLGLYWRNNWYSLDFLKATCELCMEQRIGKICITPWKSLIIAGLPEGKRIQWEKLLGRFGINARHSSLELNWHLPVGDQEALLLKQYLVREFDRQDISTYGLTFGVDSPFSRPYTSVIVERQSGLEFVDGFAVPPTYNLRYARNFDPNTRDYIEYARQVDRAELAELIVELSKLYFEQLNDNRDEVISTAVSPLRKSTKWEVNQCTKCQSVYDARLGDPDQHISVGTNFEDLPEDYKCWTCGAVKDTFQLTVLENFQDGDPIA